MEEQSGNIVVLTGAGISAESGIQTFRANDGLWESYRIEDVATPEGFAKNPQLVMDFYNARRAQLSEVSPNPAHEALARLQRKYQGKVTIITQNVDDLHERAGAKVLHMHGELKKVRCLFCDGIHEWMGDCTMESVCPACCRSGGLRPDIVWFGEMPYYLSAIDVALKKAAYFVAIGTSGQVYPAANFVQIAKNSGARAIEINVEETALSHAFDECVLAPASIAVPQWVDSMINED